jgi:hypothetical protein
MVIAAHRDWSDPTHTVIESDLLDDVLHRLRRADQLLADALGPGDVDVAEAAMGALALVNRALFVLERSR